MNERGREVITRRPGGPRDGEVMLSVVVSVCEFVSYLLQGHSGHRVRESGALGSCSGRA
jgi:hypothetical protein